MKFNKIALAALLSLTAASTVQAAGLGGTTGKITFTGSIDSAPCSIKPGDDGDNQNIPMGGISDIGLASGGFSAPQLIKIELTGCTLATQTKAITTFTGTETTLAEYAGSYHLGGSAKGAALHIRNMDGTIIKIGTPAADQAIVNGDNTLTYEAIIQGAADQTVNPTVPGTFNVPVNFKIEYA